MSQLNPKLPNAPFVLARNWDRFGGRAGELLNAYYVSKKLNLDFRFVWPVEDRFPEMDELINAFSGDFIDKHLLTNDDLEGVANRKVTLDGSLTEEEFLLFFREYPQTPNAVTLGDFFSIPIFKGETFERARHQFMLTSTEVWSEKVKELQAWIADRFKETVVIHARYGDLVSGDWRNFVDPTKYVTGRQIQAVVSEFERQGKIFALLSDSPVIKKVFPSGELLLDPPAAIVPEFKSENLETILDLFKIQYSFAVFAPQASAFSTLGAHLGGKEVQPLGRTKVDSRIGLENLISSEPIWLKLPSPIRGQLISRDLDQEINRLGGIYDDTSFQKLASEAHHADVSNPVSSCHLAIASALEGKSTNTKTILENAKIVSLGSNHIHQDPIYFVVISEFACLLINLLRRHRLPRFGKSQVQSSVEELRKLSVELATGEPYQIDKNLVSETALRIAERLDAISRARFSFLRLWLLSFVLHNVRKKFRFDKGNLFIVNLLRSLMLEIEQSKAI